MNQSNKIHQFVFCFFFFFWIMTLVPLESQCPNGTLSLTWTMVYALAAAFAFWFFDDVVVGQWYSELNGGAKVPQPRGRVRKPITFFLTIFVGFYFFSALGYLSRGAADKPFVAGRMTLASLVAAAIVLAVFYGMKWALCRKSGQGKA